MARILFVEDNDTLRDNFTRLLQREGFEVDSVSNKASALEHFDMSVPDLAILDITLGNETEAGFHLCTELRNKSQTTPIIFFTLHDSDFDKISGMRLGADDYITKDVNLDYLIVRIKALLHRVEVLTNGVTEDSNELKRGNLYINMDTLFAKWKDSPINLSLTQLWMLHALANQPGHVRSLQQLMDASNITTQPNTVAVHIKNIRLQFQKIDPEFSAIKTERGIGYRWINDN